MTAVTCRDRPFRRHPGAVATLAAAVLTLGASSTAAQDTAGAGAISGVVVDAAGQPAAGARVCALNTAWCVTSNARGRCRIGEQARYRTTIDPKTAVAFFEVPMIGGMATLGRWFINRGMRSGTPAELHDHVITVYGGTGGWKQRVSYSTGHKDDAYLIVFDPQGVVRWLHHGVFDQSRAEELKGLLTSLAGSHTVAADPAPPNRCRAP
jgi:hypothetical protein